ncbi:hypothetical protein [Planomicrobium sp. YIM 101495]|uniref:hypothetical protein n=1 Tax=Planomicrobium sp. YIM 101495 TaxID=2665160 RepID=UPI0012B9EAD5|nr:hypothetical protein [Planomicrobium sp. YIM 101495]MTD30181.1 hypothetical protein [Planomicrobium sp. YIM 101495]
MNQFIRNLIFLAGAWQQAGCNDEELERQFAENLDMLQQVSGLDREQAIALINEHPVGEVAA